jgi:hypothetical protein
MPADGISLPPTDFGTSRCGGSRLSYINGTVRPPPNGDRRDLSFSYRRGNRLDLTLLEVGGPRNRASQATHCGGAPRLRSIQG